MARDAISSEKHDISVAARSEDPTSKATARAALMGLNSWGDASPWYQPVLAGGWDAYGDVVQNIAGLSAAEKSANVGQTEDLLRRGYSLTTPGLIGAAWRGETPEALATAGGYWRQQIPDKKTICETAGGTWNDRSNSCNMIPTWAKTAIIIGVIAVAAFVVQPYVTPYLRKRNRSRR